MKARGPHVRMGVSAGAILFLKGSVPKRAACEWIMSKSQFLTAILRFLKIHIANNDQEHVSAWSSFETV